MSITLKFTVETTHTLVIPTAEVEHLEKVAQEVLATQTVEDLVALQKVAIEVYQKEGIEGVIKLVTRKSIREDLKSYWKTKGVKSSPAKVTFHD